MAAEPDGESHEGRWVPQSVEPTRQVVSGPRLWVWDRQFCDLGQPARWTEGGAPFLIRYHPKGPFCAAPPQPARESQEAPGRPVREDWGWWGAEAHARRRFVRRLT
jgi:hypothetical protein